MQFLTNLNLLDQSENHKIFDLMESNKVEVKPYNLTELANLYQVSDKTFRRWINHFKDELGEKYGNYYTVHQVRIIFKKLGLPGFLEEELL